MSSYLALARNYRPQDFSHLVGQDALVRVLSNSIEQDKLHHAFILTGIRGVGKTTTARIIAKTINCLDEKSFQDAQACNKCKNCKSIASSQHHDVIEFDAASKTGVDDVRAIIESIAYAPVSAKYKVYIIDEVHMLSNSAFNALLKTLEEPPQRVKFIFATTEIKKVPITILSRCMRFDLRRLDEIEISAHLKNILQQEGFEFEKEALEIIAKMSEGSIRDSLSLTDQVLAANNYAKNTSSNDLQDLLGLNDLNQIIELLLLLLEGNTKKSLDNFLQIYAKSSDILQIIKDLMSLIHDATLLKVGSNQKLMGYSSNQISDLKKIANEISLDCLSRFWQILTKSYSEINFATSMKMSFEMLIVRLCYVIALPNLQQVLLKVSDEENKIVVQNNDNNNNIKDQSNDLVNEILRNFEGSKILS